LHNLKFYRISFLQRPVAIADDRRIMYEYIGPVFPPDESVSFRIIEPLYCSLHFVSPLAGDSFYSWGGSENNRRHEHELRGVYQNGSPSQYFAAEKSFPVHFYACEPFQLAVQLSKPYLRKVR
jgi:hypothetical protein